MGVPSIDTTSRDLFLVGTLAQTCSQVAASLTGPIHLTAGYTHTAEAVNAMLHDALEIARAMAGDIALEATRQIQLMQYILQLYRTKLGGIQSTAELVSQIGYAHICDISSHVENRMVVVLCMLGAALVAVCIIAVGGCCRDPRKSHVTITMYAHTYL